MKPLLSLLLGLTLLAALPSTVALAQSAATPSTDAGAVQAWQGRTLMRGRGFSYFSQIIRPVDVLGPQTNPVVIDESLYPPSPSLQGIISTPDGKMIIGEPTP